MNWNVKKKVNFINSSQKEGLYSILRWIWLISNRTIISLMHIFILRRIWLNCMVIWVLPALSQFSLFVGCQFVRNLISRNVYLVHHNWYRIKFTWMLNSYNINFDSPDVHFDSICISFYESELDLETWRSGHKIVYH
jgi:hypothetical protein